MELMLMYEYVVGEGLSDQIQLIQCSSDCQRYTLRSFYGATRRSEEEDSTTDRRMDVVMCDVL
jgi:hypothetical protein